MYRFPDLVSEFLSTPSARRATHPHAHLRPRQPISIHALREEGDCAMLSPSMP